MNEFIRIKIAYLLKVYPAVSWSMLQCGLGPGFPTSLWKPVARQMINEGELTERELTETSPVGRSQTHKIVSLTDLGKMIDTSPQTGTVGSLAGAGEE